MNAQVYAWPIRHVLPAIPIPLRAPDPDVMLDLRQAFDLTYDRGLYSRLLRVWQSPSRGRAPRQRATANGPRASRAERSTVIEACCPLSRVP